MTYLSNSLSGGLSGGLSGDLPASLPSILPATPSCAELQSGKNHRKRTLTALSVALLLALFFIALIIGSGTSQAAAAALPAFTPANALAAKQDVGVAGMATASLTIIAFGALAVFSTRKKT